MGTRVVGTPADPRGTESGQGLVPARPVLYLPAVRRGRSGVRRAGLVVAGGARDKTCEARRGMDEGRAEDAREGRDMSYLILSELPIFLCLVGVVTGALLL